ICTKIDAAVPDTKKYIIHKIVYGDTLWDIAINNKCTVAEIVGLNGIEDPNSVAVGTEIKIPQR
ncbi:MAG: LysM domain-containing protein, partial [Oscillospiraceae bacterium]